MTGDSLYSAGFFSGVIFLESRGSSRSLSLGDYYKLIKYTYDDLSTSEIKTIISNLQTKRYITIKDGIFVKWGGRRIV